MFEYKFNEKYKLLIWIPTVEINGHVAMEVATGIMQLEDERPPFDRFVDLTHLPGISIQALEMQKIVDLRNGYTGPKVKAAHFAPNTLGFGIGRSYQELMKGHNVQIEVFANLKSCANWLDVPQEILKSPSTVVAD